jgi:hypothetical protein
VDLADLDDLDRVDVARRAQHHEQHVAVAFYLGPLVCADRVLDGEAVQRELLRDRLDLLGRRAQEPDPAEAAAMVGALAQLRERPVQRARRGSSLAVDIDGVVDHGHAASVVAVRARRPGATLLRYA